MRLHTIALLGAEENAEIMAVVRDVLAVVSQGHMGFRLKTDCLSLDDTALTPACFIGLDAVYACGPSPRDPAKADFAFHRHAAITPLRILPGLKSPLAGIGPRLLDWMVVHHRDGPMARILQLAFRLAHARAAKNLTLAVHPQGDHDLSDWTNTAATLGAAYFPDLTWTVLSIDTLTTRMVLAPETLDTIVTTAPHGDVLTGLAASLAGSPALAATMDLDLAPLRPPVFHPLRGYGRNIAEQRQTSPIGALRAVVMMLEHLGEVEAAHRLMCAIEQCAANPLLHAPDLRVTATLDQIATAVLSVLRRQDGSFQGATGISR